MYTIHAKIDNQMYPLLFALLPGKIQAVYAQLLTKLKTTMADLQLFMNFETAAQNAARTVFAGIIVKGSLHSSHMEKNTTHWSTSHLQKTTTFDNL